MALPLLTLGGFDLTDFSGSTYGASIIAQGTSKGSPVPIEVAVKSWLQDGSIVVTQGYDNRLVTLRVKLRAPDAVALADAEAALFAELGKPNLLTWTPGDSFSPPTVFVVVTSSMDAVEDDTSDLAEAKSYPWRHYDIRLVCEAFTRSETETVTAALPATGSTTTSLDTCSATTGWTGFIDGGAVTPTTAGGSVLVTGTVTADAHTFSLQKTFAATTTSTKFLAVDWLRPAGGSTTGETSGQGLSATGDGVALPLLAEIPSTTAGYVKSYFNVAASSLAVTRFTFAGTTPAGSKFFAITQVDVTNVNPIIGTGRQQARSLLVSGSARTQGSLAVESATAALGDGTLVYVYPRDETTSGYSPALRQFRLAGGTVTADATKVSGSTEPLTGPTTFAIPIGLFPRGSYLLMGRLAYSGGTTVHSFQTATKYGSTSIVTPAPATLVTLATTSTYQTFVLGRLQLPSVDLDAASATAGAVMWMSVASLSSYDEMWLFNTTIGQLTWVDCGTGAGAAAGSSRRLFLEPATVTTPRPTVRIGHSADRSDSHYPATALRSWQAPEFKPPQVNVFMVTPNATDAAVTLRHYQRWHTNPAS